MVGRCIPYWNDHFLGDMLVFRVFFMKSWKFSFFRSVRYEGHRHFWVSTHDMGKSAISQRGNVGDQLSDPWCFGWWEVGDWVPGREGWYLPGSWRMSSEKTSYCFEDVGIYCRSLYRKFFFSQYDLDWKQWFRSSMWSISFALGGHWTFFRQKPWPNVSPILQLMLR